VSGETILAIGYAIALLLSAYLLEWLSAHTHRRSLRYRTAGFDYDADHDLWQCPEGEQLWPHEFDRERRLVRYRAKAQVCNACPRKDDCTDSDHGREIVRPLDPWPHSEAGRFHRTFSLMLVGLAVLIVFVEAARHNAPAELAALAAVLAAALLSARWMVRDLRRHPSNFPDAAPAHGLGLPATAADGVRDHSRWASQGGDAPR
jgi:hypothetical protein